MRKKNNFDRYMVHVRPSINFDLRWSADDITEQTCIMIIWHFIVSFVLHYILSHFTHCISMNICMKCDICCLTLYSIINLWRLFFALQYTCIAKIYIVCAGFSAYNVVVVEVCDWDDRSTYVLHYFI